MQVTVKCQVPDGTPALGFGRFAHTARPRDHYTTTTESEARLAVAPCSLGPEAEHTSTSLSHRLAVIISPPPSSLWSASHTRHGRLI